MKSDLSFPTAAVKNFLLTQIIYFILFLVQNESYIQKTVYMKIVNQRFLKLKRVSKAGNV